MGRRTAGGRGRAARLAVALGLALSAACATIEAPPGGPEDKTPPRLLTAWPESGAVGLRGVRELRLAFSEKVNARLAEYPVHLYPPVAFANLDWSGRRFARITLADTLPRDTVIVVVIPAGFTDAHRVPTLRDIAYPIATADSLPRGEIDGTLLMGASQGLSHPLVRGAVELYPADVDRPRLAQAKPLRVADTDSAGQFRLPWLAVPGGPWLLRAYNDANGNRRAEEGEAERLLPDTLWVTAAQPRVSLTPVTLYPPGTPGKVATTIGDTPPWTERIFGWTENIAEGDTGWTPRPLKIRPGTQREVRRGARTIWQPAGPGKVRVILFVDVRGDSLFGRVAAAAADTTARRLDPWVMVDSLTVEPGLETDFRAPPFPATLPAWNPAATDTTRHSRAAADTVQHGRPAPADTSRRR
jgi:hypothetical protein